GKEAETTLHSVNITTNKNTIPNDTEKPFITSGIRIGSPAITSRGLKENDMLEVVRLIDKALTNSKDEAVLNEVKNDVIKLLARYPLWYKW
ncbi:MAG: serine hydroxymethyltransferase, partial [Bacilli bacterium]|nr:serine hydroxymethyltransferase [Bacilli bacterium]